MTDSAGSEADILITDELFQRSPRQPNLEAEIKVIRSLGQQLTKPPQTIFKHFAEIARDLCQAGTAGVSLIEATLNGEEVFRWVALSGAYEQFESYATPRNFSPCSVCLDRRSAQLYSHPERYFTYLQDVTPSLVEELVVPLTLEERALGTIWIVAHDQHRQFDREDSRVLTILADFLAAALSSAQAKQAVEENQSQAALRESAEAALRQSEARFQTLVRNMPGMVYRYSPSGTFSYVSSVCRELFELEPETILQDANSLWSLIHPDDLQSLRDSLAAAVRESQPWQWEGRLITLSGRLKWIQGISRPQEVPSEFVWDGLLFDITNRKQAEAALRDREAFLHLIIESAKDYAIFTLNLEGQITSWNAGAKSLSLPLTADPSPLTGVQILLVDDDTDTRDLFAFTLEQNGAIVTSVASANEALQAFEQTEFDLLISDIGMPDMDGYMFMQQVRSLLQGHQVLAIALTAYAGEVNQQQAIAAGFQQHIAKPVKLEELVKTILTLTQPSGKSP